MRKLKVYGWRSFVRSPDTGRNIQARLVVATPTKREAAILAGCPNGRPPEGLDFSESENEDDMDAAMSDPGAVFWQDINGYRPPFRRLAAAIAVEANTAMMESAALRGDIPGA